MHLQGLALQGGVSLAGADFGLPRRAGDLQRSAEDLGQVVAGERIVGDRVRDARAFRVDVADDEQSIADIRAGLGVFQQLAPDDRGGAILDDRDGLGVHVLRRASRVTNQGLMTDSELFRRGFGDLDVEHVTGHSARCVGRGAGGVGEDARDGPGLMGEHLLEPLELRVIRGLARQLGQHGRQRSGAVGVEHQDGVAVVLGPLIGNAVVSGAAHTEESHGEFS